VRKKETFYEVKMASEHESIIVYGTTWCPDCKRSKQFLGNQRVHYHWVDIEQDSESMAYVEKINNGMRVVPTIVFPDGDVLAEPSNAMLAEKLGLSTRAKRTYYDVVIIGAGPAGLTAGIYTSREGLDTLIIEKGAPGGQAGVTQVIDNFPGFDEGIAGDEFANRLTRQASRFGVEILQAQSVTDVRLNGRYREVLTSDGSCYAGKSVLIATGARYRQLNVPGEHELIGVNIHFCATCDGAFYKGKEVVVVGGGNSALEESLFLTKFATKVTILAREKLTASSMLQEKIARSKNIELVMNQHVQTFEIKENRLSGVITKDLESGKIKVWTPEGVFVFIGMSPNSGFLPPEVETDLRGFINTDDSLQTSLKGVFAAGDVRQGATAQAASAAGEGATAALMMRQYLQSIGEA
jgi:thioredoxin reductase (NADPH)